MKSPVFQLPTRKPRFIEPKAFAPLPMPLEFGRFVIGSACAASFTSLATKFASLAFPYPQLHWAEVAMLVAFLFFMVGLGGGGRRR